MRTRRGRQRRLTEAWPTSPQTTQHSFMQRPVHPSFGWVKPTVGVGGREKNEGAKKSSKTIDIVSYSLEVSVNGVTCVCSPFQVI